jgi:DNA-binding transcriptional MerR regulator
MIATIARPRETPMPDDQTESPPTTKRETWRDWLPNQAPTLSVDELLQRVQELDVACDLRTLRSWQTQKVLPFPIRQRIGKGVYAAYPAAAVDFIVLLRKMQGQGVKLKEIGSRLRARAQGVSDRPLYREFVEKLKEAAALQAQLTGAPVKQVHVTFTDDAGLDSSYTIGRWTQWRVSSGAATAEE